MKNTPIGKHEEQDIRKHVLKVLRGLGNPDPPLDLTDVRDLLKLDLQYFSSTDDSALREFVSKVRRAGKQIVRRPKLLLDVVREFKLSALWIPDKRRILIDESTPMLKHRWFEAHEITHGLPKWHARYLFGDDAETLSPAFHEQLENEANFGAGQLLFLQERFVEEASDYPIELASVKDLSKTFGNTMTSTLWRFAEEAHRGIPVVGVVSAHPDFPTDEFDPINPCRYCIESDPYRARFSNITEAVLYEVLKMYCERRRGGPVGELEVLIPDNAGENHVFNFESFYNQHDVLTLGVYRRKHKPVIAVP